MRNNPRLDLIAETYTNQVASNNPGVVVMEIDPSQEAEQQPESDPSEIKMALAELRKAKEYAGKLEEMLQSVQGLEGWTAAKITKASDYLSSVYHWLDYEGGDDCKSHFNMGYEDGEVQAYEDGE